MEDARATVLVARGSVIGSLVRGVRAVAGDREMPHVLRRLGQTGGHGQDQAGDEKTGREPAHGRTVHHRNREAENATVLSYVCSAMGALRLAAAIFLVAPAIAVAAAPPGPLAPPAAQPTWSQATKG